MTYPEFLEGLTMQQAEELPESPREARKLHLLSVLREEERMTSTEAAECVDVHERAARRYMAELAEEHDDIAYDRLPPFVDGARSKTIRVVDS